MLYEVITKDLRVVVVGDQVHSYWRKAQTFLHNVAQGGEIDTASDKKLQEVGREKVREFCRRSGINLAAFDLVFPAGDDEPFFLEINYTRITSYNVCYTKLLREFRNNETKTRTSLQS